MSKAIKFFLSVVFSASFFLILKFKFLNNYMTFDKDQASCEGSSVDSDCHIWYDNYSLCLKGNQIDGVCKQKDISIPVGLIAGGIFFALLSIFIIFE